jgi:predicted chitinase
MAINRNFFFDNARMRLFSGKLQSGQVQGITAILDKWEATRAAADDRWLAYMLATAYHETARTMQPVRETLRSTDDQAIAVLENAYKKGQLPWVSNPYWRKDAQGRSWLGRGLVQLTHFDNYKRMGAKIGIDLVTDPSVAMKMDVALDIMFIGMEQGLFTSSGLPKFFSGPKEDWVNARKIINGLERAPQIADYGKTFYSCISYTL